MNILIVGGLGRTAEPIIDLLYEANHSISLFDVSTSDSHSFHKNIKVIHGDICKYGEINKAVRGIDIVIHLAVNVFDTKNDALSFQTNVFGTYNILRCALDNGVKKVMTASSAPVHTLVKTHQADYICSAGEDFSYDLTKNIQELMAQKFSQTYAMNNLILRLGHIVNGRNYTDLEGRPLSDLLYCRGGWVCKYDVAKAFCNAVETDFTGYHLINVIGSYQAADRFDLSSCKKLINFECGERFLEYGD